MADLNSTELAWAQIEYEQQIPDLCYRKMEERMEEINESRDTKTVTLYHMLHGDKRFKPRNLLYAPQIPFNFAAANKNLKPPAWYSLIVEGDPDNDFPDPNEERTPDIHYMLEIRNGFVKRASCQDVEYLQLLHDLVLKVEANEKQALKEQNRPASEYDDGGEDDYRISVIAPLRHVLFEFMHYDWEHKKMGHYCTQHLGERWLYVNAKSAPHHANLLIQKLEEIAKLRPQARLTIPVGSGKSIGNEPFATPNIVHPLPRLVESPRCTVSYFVELWEVTNLATDYIKDWRPDPADYTEAITFLDRLSDVWFQDLSMLYEKDCLLFQDPKEERASQIASIKAIREQVPSFCSLAVLPRWHGIPYMYAQLKEKWGVTDTEAEDLDAHLHVAYDEILTEHNGEDLEMKDEDD
jgi:hypothetical protein